MATKPESDRDAALPPLLRAALERMSGGLVGREEQARCLLLAALCGEHVLLLGPPGTAKSELARRLRGVVGGRFFERLLTRFTVPEELFGPLSLAALDEGRYLREIDGYLPTATVAFLDEVFKANSAILNALLTLLNERAFDQGAERIDVPLATLVGASNELPADEALRAFLDRFLFTCRVAPVSAGPGFDALLRSPADDVPPPLAPMLSAARIDRLRADAATVRVPDPVFAALGELRGLLAGSAYAVSDRRWVRAVRALRLSAASHGRDRVVDADLWVLRWILASEEVPAERIGEWVAARLGGERALEPVRLARVAQAWDKQLEIEQTATELAFDDSGKLALARGLGGATEGTMSDAAPRMSAFSRRRRFSATHVRARLAQLDAVIAEVDGWLASARAHRAEVAAELGAHLWIGAGDVSAVLERLGQGVAAVEALRGGLAATREAFAALPLAETDDGRIPGPVPA